MHCVKRAFAGAALVAMAIGLGGCGGGGGAAGNSGGPGIAGGPTSAASTIAGRWTGGAGAQRVLQTHTFPDGSVWAIYSEGSSSLHGGFLHASGSVAGSTVSGVGRDFNMDGAGITAATFNAQVTPKQLITGTASGDRAMNFSGTYESEFELAPSLATVAGTYLGNVSVVSGVSLSADTTVTVSASGALSGSMVGGCTFTGQITPRADGNAFNLNVSFAGSCPQGPVAVSGIAYYQSAQRVLKVAGASSNETTGALGVLFRTSP